MMERKKKPSVTIADVNSWLDENNDYQYLEEGVDYTLSYSNNTNAGTASVTITGINCYTGTKTVNLRSQTAAVAEIQERKISRQQA